MTLLTSFLLYQPQIDDKKFFSKVKRKKTGDKFRLVNRSVTQRYLI